MQSIKQFIITLDYIVAGLWGFTLIDLFAIISTGTVLSSVDNIIKVLFALVGLIYTILRMHHFFLKSKIDREIRKEELEKLHNENNKK